MPSSDTTTPIKLSIGYPNYPDCHGRLDGRRIENINILFIRSVYFARLALLARRNQSAPCECCVCMSSRAVIPIEFAPEEARDYELFYNPSSFCTSMPNCSPINKIALLFLNSALGVSRSSELNGRPITPMEESLLLNFIFI